MYGILRFCALLPLAFLVCANSLASQLRDGDIIFQTSRSSQSKAIQKATHSKFSHVGIIFLKNGKPYVFEAAGNVQYTRLNKWIARGDGRHYVVKRLRLADQLLTPEAVSRLRKVANTFQGKPYDPAFEWSDERIYCSELVWKIYDRAMDIRVGGLHKLGDFDLSDVAVQTKMRERYGDHVPLEETVISPADIYASDNLMMVNEK